jgi:hypothetical protein
MGQREPVLQTGLQQTNHALTESRANRSIVYLEVKSKVFEAG